VVSIIALNAVDIEAAAVARAIVVTNLSLRGPAAWRISPAWNSSLRVGYPSDLELAQLSEIGGNRVIAMTDEPLQDWTVPIREHLRAGDPFQIRTFVAYTSGAWRAEVAFAGANNELAIPISRAETRDPVSAYAGASAGAGPILSRLFLAALIAEDDEPSTS
jgi:hypothetical protein